MGKDSGGSQTTTVQQADPWSGQQPYLQDLFAQAQDLYYNQPQSYYPGQTVAPFNADQLQAQQWLKNYALNGATDLTNRGLEAQAYMLDPNNMLDVANNQYVQAMNDAAAQDLTTAGLQQVGAYSLAGTQNIDRFGRTMGDTLEDYQRSYETTRDDIANQLQRNWIPAIDSGAVAAGQYGGSRQGVAQGLALSDATKQLTDYGTNFANAFQQSYDTSASTLGNYLQQADMGVSNAISNNADALAKMLAETNLGAYNTGLQTMQRATALNPTMVQSGTLPMQMLDSVGAQNQAMQQAQIDDAVARWNYEQALPQARLEDYANMVRGTYGGSSSSTTEGDTGQTSTLGKVAGAAMTGLGTYGALASSTASVGGVALIEAAPWAAAAMALFSLFS
jgi:hypothetical protein